VKTVYGIPVFFSDDQLLKHREENNDMDWDEIESGLYERFWQNPNGDQVTIEDVTKILSPTEQTHLSDFNKEQYRVLEQGRYQPEARLQETFQDLEGAEEYVSENYEIDI